MSTLCAFSGAPKNRNIVMLNCTSAATRHQNPKRGLITKPKQASLFQVLEPVSAASDNQALNTHQRSKQNMTHKMSLNLNMPIHTMISIIHRNPKLTNLSGVDWGKAGSHCFSCDDQQGAAEQQLKEGVAAQLSCQVVHTVTHVGRTGVAIKTGRDGTGKDNKNKK